MTSTCSGDTAYGSAAWVCMELGELFDVVSGGTPSTKRDDYWGSGYPWITSADIDESGRITPRRTVTQAGVDNSATNVVPAGTVIVVTRVAVGKVALAPTAMCFSQDSQALLPRARVFDARFVQLQLRHMGAQLRARSQGTTISGITKGTLTKFRLVVPPLVEQRAIVAKIEALFRELDKGIEQLQTVRHQLKQYRQAVLKAAFEGRLTAEWRYEQQAAGKLPDADESLEQVKKEREERYQQQLQEWKQAVAEWEAAGGKESGRKKPGRPPKLKSISAPAQAELPFAYTMPSGWCWIRVGDLTLGVEYGTSEKSSDEGCYPVLRMGNIQDCRFDWTDLAFSNNVEEFAKYKLRLNDVLFNRTNSPELVGKTAVFKGEREALFAGYLIRINQIGSIVDADYLNYYLNSVFARQYGNRVKTDGVNQSNINGTKLAACPFPYCCMDEQRAIVSEVESRFSVLEVLDKATDEGLKQAEALRQSILKKAFEGRLLSEAELTAVRNDPEYEPADKLLERIQAERGQDKQSSGTRRTRTRTRRKTVRQSREDVEETVNAEK